MDEISEQVQTDENTQGSPGCCYWYTLYTKPHKEYLVQEVLSSHGVEIYLPQIPVVIQRRDRRSMKPFLPQYLFAHFDPDVQHFADICWTPGLRCIVSAGGRPVIVPDEVVAYLRRRLKTMQVTDTLDAPFKKGKLSTSPMALSKGWKPFSMSRLRPKAGCWSF
jgi:transcriptional antiterminator RfaH